MAVCNQLIQKNDGFQFICSPEEAILVEIPGGSVLVYAPEAVCDKLRNPSVGATDPSPDDMRCWSCSLPAPPRPEEMELPIYNGFKQVSPPPPDGAPRLIPISRFLDQKRTPGPTSVPLLRRHLKQVLLKLLPSRRHPIFDMPPPQGAQNIAQNRPAPPIPPLADDPNAMARADPGWNPEEPKPASHLICGSNLFRVPLTVEHFRCCSKCSPYADKAAHLAKTLTPEQFGVQIFDCFHRHCYAQHLYRGVWFGYEPHCTHPITEFKWDNYPSLYEVEHKTALEKAWQKQLNVKGCFDDGDARYLTPLTLAFRFIDKWEAAISGKPAKARVCFDASRGINPNLSKWKFRYTDFPFILSKIHKGDFIASFDLRSWYLQLSIRKSFQKILSLRSPFSQKILRYARMPFGLSTAPAWASLISAELTKMLKARGIDCVIAYLDDFFIIAPSAAEAQRGLDVAMEMLSEFNIKIAPEKIVTPTQSPTILGIIVDTTTCQLRVRKEHLDWALTMIRQVLKKRKLSLKKTQSMAGVLNWICPLLKGSRPFMRGIWDFTKLFSFLNKLEKTAKKIDPKNYPKNALSENRTSDPNIGKPRPNQLVYGRKLNSEILQKMVKLTSRRKSKFLQCPDAMLEDLRWWRSSLYRLQRNGGEMDFMPMQDRPTSVIFSDASGDKGCGVWYKKHLFSHRWDAKQLEWSVPHKELFPIWKTLQRFGHKLKNHLVLACTDSSTNVFALCAGSSTSLECNKLLKRISRLERLHKFDVIGLWLPREFNIVTDQISKFNLFANPLFTPSRQD